MKIKLIANIVRAIIPTFLLWALPLHAATLLPNGEQTFLSNNGQPLSSGKVYFYIPGTTTPKNTWKDSAQTILNTNPVILNAAGRAIIYGSGIYRQIVKDNTSNTIWDQLSTDTSGSFSSFGGTSTGSSNAQVVNGTNFSTTIGQSIVFIAGFTNSGPITLSPDNGVTNYATVIDTPTGPVPLIGGEIVLGNVVTATFDGNAIFHLIPSARTNSVGTIAATATTDLGSTGTNVVKITGSTTITSFGSTASVNSPMYDVFFVNGTTVDASTQIVMGFNVTFAAGDFGRFMYLGNGNWQLVTYQSQAFNIIGNNLVLNGNASFGGGLTSGTDSHLNTSGALYSGNATGDALYSGINGAIITAPGGAIRAQNVVSARASFSGSGFNSTFNVANIANAGTGVYNVTFTEAFQNNNYNVVAACSLSSANALVCPLVSNKSNGGFTLTFFNTSGAATNIGSNISDLIVSGGY